jgi:hypothetical protein
VTGRNLVRYSYGLVDVKEVRSGSEMRYETRDAEHRAGVIQLLHSEVSS